MSEAKFTEISGKRAYGGANCACFRVVNHGRIELAFENCVFTDPGLTVIAVQQDPKSEQTEKRLLQNVKNVRLVFGYGKRQDNAEYQAQLADALEWVAGQIRENICKK